MKTRILFACAILSLGASKLFATDLCVEENGNGGCYSTITAAVAAAANGDRIIINPKAGNAAYVENISVNKTLQFLCAVEGGQYIVQGTWTIVPAIGRAVTIIGMKNLTGDITSGIASPVGARTKVNFIGSELSAGSISFDVDNFDITVSSSVITGNVVMHYGKLFGNVINSTGYSVGGQVYTAIAIYGETTIGTDSIYIVGNKISCLSGSYYPAGINWASNSQYLYCVNNLITYATWAGYYGMGVQFNGTHAIAAGRNTFSNNTVYRSGTPGPIYGVYAPSISCYTDIINNVFLASSGYGIYGGGAITGISYNYMPTPVVLGGSAIDDGTNNLSSNTTIDANGRLIAGSDGINGASPDFSYYDLDLSIGDAGCYGGSLTLDNFFPVNGGARVYMVTAPRRVNVSGTINIKADGFDR